jgi:hypothetical protein
MLTTDQDVGSQAMDISAVTSFRLRLQVQLCLLLLLVQVTKSPR